MLTDFETTLAAALAALPSRRPGQTIVARLGVSAQEAGLHTRRTRRRQFQDFTDQTTAAEQIVARLPMQGETHHWLLDGSFTLASVIPVIQSHTGQPVALTVCTLGLNDSTTDLLAGMLKDGRLASLRLAMSSYFKASDPATAQHAITTLTAHGAQVAVERIHCKLQLYRPTKGRDRYTLETSSNLRSCQCVEQASLTNDRGLFHWHDQWLTKFFAQNTITL